MSVELKGPGTLFLYPRGMAAIKFVDVTVLQWPNKVIMGDKSYETVNITFRHNEKDVGWQIASTDLPYIYTEKLQS